MCAMAQRQNVLSALSALTLACVLGVTAPAANGMASAGDSRTTALSLGGQPAVAAKRLAPTAWEKKILKLTNKQRVKHSCRPLKQNGKLRKAAVKHSKLMAAADTLSHQLPGEASLGNRITAAGYRNWRGVAENIAYGYPTPKSMVTAWMNSPGHRRNILNCTYRDLGVGVKLKDGIPWATQDFGRK